MPRQPPHDPFADALRPTTSNATSLAATASLRTQTSQHSLRSNTSNNSGRARQGRDLFAPSLSRRGTTPRFDDEVLADSDSEQDLASQRQRQARRARHGSPSRLKSKQDEDPDFVNRQPDGSYLLGVAGLGETVAVPHMSLPKSEEEQDQEEMDAYYASISRQFFTTGQSLGGKSSKKHDEELEQLHLRMLIRLREQVTQQLEDERWKYEAT